MVGRNDLIAVVERLARAINDRDLEGLANCFAPGTRNVTPAHPERSFRGRDQVRRNWEQIFAGVPELTATVVRCAVDVSDPDTVWVEWDWSGARADGSPLVMRGVTIFGIADGQVQWLRFFMEELQRDGVRIDAAVRHHVTGGP